MPATLPFASAPSIQVSGSTKYPEHLGLTRMGGPLLGNGIVGVNWSVEDVRRRAAGFSPGGGEGGLVPGGEGPVEVEGEGARPARKAAS